MKEAQFETGPVVLHVASGPPIGPPVVLLHGLTRRWQDWLVVAPYLAPRWQVFALDFRGHGRSGRTPGAYRIADHVPDIVAFVRQRLDEAAILIGHSLGGNVAAAVAAELPGRVRALVLEDPAFEMGGPRLAETPFLETFRAFLPHAGSDRAVAAIAADLAEARIVLPGAREPVRLGDVRDAVSLRFTAASLKRLDPEALRFPIEGRWLEGSDLPSILPRIGCPTLLLQAEFAAGGILPDEHAAAMAALIPDCTRMKMAGIGHTIHVTATEAMMRLVIPFLGALD
jgi:pimeloyl-ACP methyl ester carboxylesterase